MPAKHKTIEELRKFAGKCPRCSLCKFPPLNVVESKRHSSICPSYDEYKFHSHSGGGRIIMAMSLQEGRCEVDDEMRDIVFQCTLCGGCDMACKFSSDIEILEMLYALRAESFQRKGPLPKHKEILDRIDKTGHPIFAEGAKGDWLKDAGLSPSAGKELLLYVGCRYALIPERRKTLLNLVSLLKKAGYDFSVIGDGEPCCGRMALDIGDQDRFSRMANATIDAIKKSGAKKVVCADAECLSTLRGHFPKVGELGVEVVHPVELLADAVKKKKLKFTKSLDRRVAYHDPCNLGRLSETYKHWDGQIKKVMGQMVIYDPPRPVNRGTNGCYAPPRQLLDAIPGMKRVEFERKREYSYCCGGAGVAYPAFPEFSDNTALNRMNEAKAVGADVVVTACPNCVSNLSSAAAATGVKVIDLYDALAQAV